MSRVTVIGCGHVGLVTAAGLASEGHVVTGLDRNVQLVEDLRHGHVRLWEDGLLELVQDGLSSGKLSFTTAAHIAMRGADFIVLCVDTPEQSGGAASLKSIRSAVADISGNLPEEGPLPIVVTKSTSPVGTGETVEEMFGSFARGLIPRIVSAPEFLRQGHAVDDFRSPDRVVVGSDDPEAARAVAELMAGSKVLPHRVVITDLRTAEMTKYVANAFLATRVSFINEIAQLCEAVGADIDDVVAGISWDERIGGSMFTPGIGYGGSCLPKDVAALRYVGAAHGVPTPLLGAVTDVNRLAPGRIVHLLRQRLGYLYGRTIGVWGLTFKGGTEDARSSPAVTVVELLKNEGASVQVWDPGIAGFGSGDLDGLLSDLVWDPEAACVNADALLVLSDWSYFAEYDLLGYAQRMRGKLVIDGRNVLDPEAVREAGLTYVGFGFGRGGDLEAVAR